MHKSDTIIRHILLGICFLLMAAGTAESSSVTVRVEGVEGDVRSNIEAALTLPEGLAGEGGVDLLWLKRFGRQAPERVRTAMEPFGYYDARVTAALSGDESSGFLLAVTVTSGEPVHLERVEVSATGAGRDDPSLAAAMADFSLKQGDVPLHKVYEEAKARLLAAAREPGYLDAAFTVHELSIDTARGAARISLVMDTGPRYLFGEARFEGGEYFPDRLLQRYVAFSPGDTFSYALIGATRMRLGESGYFSDIRVIPDKAGAVDRRIPVTIRVTPAPRRVLRPGVGYGSDTGVRGSLNYRDLYLLRPGNTLDVETTVSERLQGIGAGYSIPGSDDLRSVTALQVNVQQEQVNSTRSRLALLELSHAAGFGESLLGTIYLRYQRELFSVGLQQSDATLLLPGLRLSLNGYDDLIRPASGYHLSIEVRGTHPVLGSDVGFIQLLLDGGVVMPLPWQLSLTTRARGGRSFMDDRFADLPASLRFFAGGNSSVRGYAYKSLGPKDASGAVVGGKHLVQGSIELERRLFSDWGVSLFYDAGNAFDGISDFRLYQGGGTAVHYHSRIGSVNLGLARQIDVDRPVYRLHFSIGFKM